MPVALQGHLEADLREDRRHDVDMLGVCLDDASARHVRAPDDQRDVKGLWVEPVLAEHPVVAEHLAVIGGEDDQRPVEHPPAGQRIDDAPDVVVHLGDQARAIDRFLCPEEDVQ